MTVIIYLLLLPLILFQLLILFLCCVSVYGLVKSLCSRPKTFLEFLNFYTQFWADLCYNVFIRKKN